MRSNYLPTLLMDTRVFSSKVLLSRSFRSCNGDKQRFHKKTIEEINEEGYKTIYSDSVDGKTKVIVKEKIKFMKIK